MENKFAFYNNKAINTLLNENRINEQILIEMDLQLKQYQILNKDENLYLCSMYDGEIQYNKFILKASQMIMINDIIRLKKIRIVYSETDKYISILDYEIIKYDKYFKEIEHKKINYKEEDLNNEINIKQNEEPIKDKNIDNEEIIKEKEKNEILNEKLNEETKLILKNLKHSKTEQRCNFKWEKSKIILLEFENKIEEENENEKCIKIDLSFDSDDISDNKNKENENKKDKPNEEEDIDMKEIEEIFKDELNTDKDKKDKKPYDKNKKPKNKYELIVNLTPSNCKKPIYVKCIEKKLIKRRLKNRNILNFIFRDSEGGEIPAIAMGAKNIKKFDRKITVNGLYTIFNYKIDIIQNYTGILACFRLFLNYNTKVKQMPPDDIFNEIHFHLLKIEDIMFFKEGCLIDTCGIIYDEGELKLYQMGKKQILMRNVIIGDNSMKKIIITLYEPYSNNTKLIIKKGEILAIKYGKIAITNIKIKKLNTDYNTILQNTTGIYYEDLILRQFYDKNQNINNFTFIIYDYNYKQLKEINETMKYNSENNITNCKLTFVTKAFIQKFYLDKDSVNKGCPLCSKKLNIIDKDKYECFVCKKTYRYPKYFFKW